MTRTLHTLLRPLLLVAAVLFASSSSLASGAVPMCSEDGRSVTAPPIMMPNRGVVLESPSGCSELLALLQHSPDEERGVQAPSDPLPRAMPVRAAELRAPRIGRLAIGKQLGHERNSARSSIERPPKPRA